MEFDVRAGIVKAVDGLNFDIRRGQTMGVIGESRLWKIDDCQGDLSNDP